MKLKTKFDIGQVVFIIAFDRIIKAPIRSITYVNGNIHYEILIHEPKTKSDSRQTAGRREKDVFKSLDDLIKAKKP